MNHELPLSFLLIIHDLSFYAAAFAKVYNAGIFIIPHRNPEQAALADTMKDLIVDTAGAFAMSAILIISLKNDKRWPERLELKFSDE